jgi:hypothetical protein
MSFTHLRIKERSELYKLRVITGAYQTGTE